MTFAAFLEPNGPVVAGEGKSLVQVNQDGDVRAVGVNAGTKHTPGPINTFTVVESGPLRFAIPGSYPPGIIECSGRLWEMGTQTGPNVCHGVIRGIIWHREILKVTRPRKDVEYSEGVGYYEGAAISSTSAIPASTFGAFEFIVELLGSASQDVA
jgi:hypothetical protein